jgi:hypothetical protein
MPIKGYGGIELVLEGLVPALKKKGVEVELFANGEHTIRGIKTHSLYKTEQFGHIYEPYYESFPIVQAHLMFAYNKIKEDGKFDIVHSNVPHVGPSFWAMATRDKDMPPVLSTFHGPPFTGGTQHDIGATYNTDDLEQISGFNSFYAACISDAMTATVPKNVAPRTTILELARLQGVGEDIAREEELGRIVHEARSPDDPIAQKLSAERGWGWPYYGSVDATPEFIRTLTAYCQRSEENRGFLAEEYTDLNGETQTISHALEMALAWIQRRLNMNAEGLLEYNSPLPLGIENQVWKDSWDAYHHADGAVANHSQGIASIEVQVTTYDALIDAAELFEDILDQQSQAAHLRSQAETLKRTVLETFWTNDKGGYFVLGTDRDENGQLRQLKIRTSNMGHTLNSRILKGSDPDIIAMRDAVVRQLFSPEMLNVSGIRTLASDEYRFRPGAYHNGSVWLWDTHHIAKGLRRLGYTDKVDELDRRILRVVEDTHIFPEYVRGDFGDTASTNDTSIVLWDSINNRQNMVEQPPQEVQAWTVAAILATTHRIRRGFVGLVCLRIAPQHQ